MPKNNKTINYESEDFEIQPVNTEDLLKRPDYKKIEKEYIKQNDKMIENHRKAVEEKYELLDKFMQAPDKKEKTKNISQNKSDIEMNF